MSAQPEPRRRPATRIEAEEDEIDLGRYWRAVASRWWLLVVGLVIGAAIGFAVTAGGSRPYQASTVFYFGQPFVPGNGGQIQNLPTQVALARVLVGTLRERSAVAAAIGVPRSRLVDNVKVEAVDALKRKNATIGTPLAQVTVTKLPVSKAVLAADVYARRLVAYFSRYATVKLGTYNARLARAARELKKANAAIATAQERERTILADRSLPSAEKFLLLANLNNVLITNQTRQATLEAQQLTLRDNIALADQVERARIVERASVDRQPAPSKRSGAAIGGFIGVLLGLLATLLWDPLERRYHRTGRAPV